VDLDGFKNINDTLGHDAGDALLVTIALRLRHSVREADRVARLGGDEFAVLLTQTSELASVELVCRRILTSLAEPIVFKDHIMQVTGSIGSAQCPARIDHRQPLQSRRYGPIRRQAKRPKHVELVQPQRQTPRARFGSSHRQIAKAPRPERSGSRTESSCSSVQSLATTSRLTSEVTRNRPSAADPNKSPTPAATPGMLPAPPRIPAESWPLPRADPWSNPG